ncbi:MAG: mechanosensitive ion channel protein [Rhodobacteraceae bacterium]|jgi:small-conductance mechanosensitive channel|uniref:Mechanosensitive ion channel n=1 Tax=Salipiger profundus TaxID=1229727 RepID=A0A1U7D1R8_9RHOB|nr:MULTISPECIES: mechanosensitive ion channel domain-containing protein [Salipiger]APX22072.1 Mechanosensitive ion channel [Salipiger profundus]MAB08240.1 mechanosensitive ion channel protein [Paracoccaceae bacterium]GGA07346.1 mechanosensitive ion channel protein [Salipiger profundus]SFC43656.1 Mechanosensitive ion channel [Salipiger profundus]
MNPTEVGQTPLEALQATVLLLLAQAESFLATFLRPWNFYQIGIALGLFLLAHLLKMALAPRMRDWMRARDGWPTWRMRILIVIHRRLRMIFFVALILLVVAVMRQVTWPSRSYLLGIIAQLATAWLVIALVTRLIGNPTLRIFVRYGAWAWVTVSIVGLTEQARGLLESMGFELGGTYLSVWLLLQAIVLLVALVALARFLAGAGAASIRRNETMSPSMQVLAVKFLQVLLYGAAFFLALKLVGVDLTGLAVLSGAIGVGLGFGLQKVVSNLVSGVIILLDKSIKPGDVISIGETFGWINALGARYVSITTRDGKEFLIPNEDLITGQVVNWSHSNDFVRLDIYFGTAYENDPHEVRRVAIAAAGSVPRVLSDRPPVCHIVGFGDSSVDYILRFWITDPSGGLTNIRGNVYLALWDAFKEHDIHIPFPQREVRLLNETLPPVSEA